MATNIKPEDNGKAMEQQYIYNTDQQVSINGFFDTEINGETVRFQVTNRYGAKPEKIVQTVRAAIEAYATLRQEYPRQFTQPAPQQPQEPAYEPIDDNGNKLPDVKTARAGRLSVEMKDGKYFYKIMDAVFAPGEKSTKYGINVWPEVLTAAKLDVSNPAALPNISGWHVDYICNDKGYPGKVTRLLPGPAPY